MGKERKTAAGSAHGSGSKVRAAADRVQDAFISAIDRNGNGRIDRGDLGLTREDMRETTQKVRAAVSATGQSVRTATDRIGDAFDEARLEADRRKLRPVTKTDLDISFGGLVPAAQAPKLIRIVGRDKKRAENPACIGAVGYWTTVREVEVLNLYEDCAAWSGLEFLPCLSQTFYYVDPYRTKVFVALDDYFDHMKKSRVNELKVIAQQLGAKQVRISFKEHRKGKAKLGIRAEGKVDILKSGGSYDRVSDDLAHTEIASNVTFSGHDTPQVPTLTYFKNEDEIGRLVQMRTGGSQNQVKVEDYRFQCSRSIGMTEKTALKLDGVLHQLKCSGSTDISREVQRESRTELEYHIEF